MADKFPGGSNWTKDFPSLLFQVWNVFRYLFIGNDTFRCRKTVSIRYDVYIVNIVVYIANIPPILPIPPPIPGMFLRFPIIPRNSRLVFIYPGNENAMSAKIVGKSTVAIKTKFCRCTAQPSCRLCVACRAGEKCLRLTKNCMLLSAVTRRLSK